MKGNLIVIEGLDGSGKNTQTGLLANYFKSQNLKCRQLSFPNYSSTSSSLVKMYLNSEFGSDPNSVNAYAAASFYAVDRYANFKSDWEKEFNSGTTIICDRYTTSNAFYQLCKLEKSLWESYLTWLYDYEYNKLGLPRPSTVIYLDCKIEFSQKLLKSRYSGDETKKDIHESNISFLKKCSEAANYVAQKDNWSIIDCCTESGIKDKNEIHKEILKITKKEVRNETGI